MLGTFQAILLAICGLWPYGNSGHLHSFERFIHICLLQEISTVHTCLALIKILAEAEG